MVTRYRALMDKVPRWAKIVTGLGILGSLLYSTVDVVAMVVETPALVQEHEHWIDNTEPLLKYLVCRSIERDAGRETGACIFLLRDSDLYQEFVELGLIRKE